MPIHLPPLSRREFVRRTLAAGAGLMLGPALRSAARETDASTFALLSDPHIAADPARMARGITMAAQFQSVVSDVLAQASRPAAVIVNGDLAFNTGETADYATFNRLVDPIRGAQIPLHLGLGNHDHRERFWAAVRSDATVPRPVGDRQVVVVSSPHANWFILDSLDKTNSTPGVLGMAQLAWLARTLDQERQKPAIVVVHHNPRSNPEKPTLIDEDAFYAVLRPRRQVKAYIFGHSHRWSVTQDASGLQLINLPTSAYVFETGQPVGWVQARLRSDGIRLQLRCIDSKRSDHGQIADLTWRTS